MSPNSLQTPEQMLERWQGVACSCDPDVGHLCEICHDIQVVRDLMKELAIYKGGFDSMAAQMIHPKMTGREMAEMQLKGIR
jgi:hypothetical protein